MIKYYKLVGNSAEVGVCDALPLGGVAYTVGSEPQELIDALTYVTPEDLALSITDKATEIIEAMYPPLKQRKLMSIAIALMDKRATTALTIEEEALLQANRDVNTWLTAVRTIENTAIANGTLLDAIDWTV